MTRLLIALLMLQEPACSRPGTTSAPRDAPATPYRAPDPAMRAHYRAGADIQGAIVAGDLARVRDEAAWLARLDENAAPSWAPYLAELNVAVDQLAHAANLPAATGPAAKVARACGRCHEGLHVQPRLPFSPAPATEPVRYDDIARRMDHHAWAAARMWDGVVGPSDELWQKGARALASSRITPPGSGLRADLDALAARQRELAVAAIAITGLEPRTDQLARILSTCAGCHALLPRAD